MSREIRATRLRRAGKVGAWTLGVLGGYVLLGNGLHQSAFKLPPPDPATYPVAGDVFSSEYEGFTVRIVDVVDGMAVVELVIEPGAVGPPLHYHKGFAEEFVVKEGLLHIELKDRVVTLGPGESHRVEPLTLHRPFNPGSERVVVSADTPLMPQSFAACLAQVYPLLDEAQGVSLSLIMQMSVIDPICDSHLAVAPRPVLVALNLFLAPAARMRGYTNYDASRSLHPPPAGNGR